MGSPKEHIEEIRRNKFSIGKEPNPLIEDLHQAVKNLSVELYTKDVHFLMELIQNAEDNVYSKGVKPSLEFIITSKDITSTGAAATLLIFNNEKGFSAKNIESICSVGRSTKKGKRSSGYIGEKGIGFKSVFLVTTEPYIFSNGYQIRFNEKPCPHCGLGYVVPEWVEEKATLEDIKNIYGARDGSIPTTTIVLPLKSDKVKPVKQQLSDIHPELLLFLSKIRHLYYMWKQKFPVMLENVVERRMGVEECVVTLAFPNQERLHRGKTSPGVYAYLPTEMVTNFPFIIQADFVLASSRETILLDDKWNHGILECVPSAFVDAFKTLIIGSNQAPVSTLAEMFKFIPIETSPYQKLNNVREKIKEKLVEENIIPIETYKVQKYFYKPREVGRLDSEFWDILDKARAEGVYLHNLSSHGWKILSSSLDMSKYDGILNFLGVQQVKLDWYAKCIQSSNLVGGVSEEAYMKLLLFVAKNWGSMFRGSNMENVPLLKYLVITYAHFLYHSFSKRYISGRDFDTLCRCMPLVDSYGCVNKSRKGVLVPASASKWANLIVSNPWRKENYIELGKEYLHPSCYAGQTTKSKKLIKFLSDHLGASDIPDIRPPNAGFPAVDTPLTKDNAFLLLGWIQKLKYTGVSIPDKFLKCIKEGSWLKVTVNGWMPPCKSFLIGSSLGKILQSGSVLVDIPLVDENYYGTRIHEYEKELKTIGVMFSYEEACEFIARQLMQRAASFNLSRSHVILMLKFIQHQRQSCLPVDNFVNSIRNGSWLKTSHGLRSPVGSVLYDSEWEVASRISAIPFIDRDYFGEEINNFKEELKLLGVIVGFSKNYNVVIDHLKSPSNFANLKADVVMLLLECIKFSSGSDKLLNSLKGSCCLKTNLGFKTPGECFLSDPVWGCILELFNCLAAIDHKFYGEKIFTYKGELKQIGAVVDFEEAIKKFGQLFKQKASQTSFNQHVKSFLSCCRLLKGSGYRFPADFLVTVHKEKWLHTRVGDYRSPRDCILDGVEWKSISSITCLPFIDDSDNCYGKGIYEYKEELKSIGAVTKFKDGVKFVPKCLNFPSDPSIIIPESVFSFLECIRLLLKGGDVSIEGDFRKIMSGNWLKTHAGYRPPEKCLLFDSKWNSFLKPTEGPFIDENFYGPKIASYKRELDAIGVIVDIEKGCCLVASHLDSLSEYNTIVQIYRYLSEHNWKPTDKAARKIWIPKIAKWVYPEDCVIHDQDNLFGSEFYVLGDIYDKKILPFFSFAMEVRNKPSLDNYVDLWNDWESSVEQLSYDKCSKFWMFMLKHLSTNSEKKLCDNLVKLPATSRNNEIFLLDKNDVFIPDSLHLKKLFELEKVFVWYPLNLAPSSKCNLFDLYRKIGARNISEAICTEEPSLLSGISLKKVDFGNICDVKVLVKLILGFLACSSLKMEPNKRIEAVKGLLNLSFFETTDAVSVSYSLSLSSGDIITKKANKMVRWEKQCSKFFTQMNWESGHSSLIKYATYFSEAISEGILCENHDHVPALSQLITLAFVLKFNNEAIDFLMESKNYQIFCEDDEFLSSAFPFY
uniref:Sacsin/Nov domain-containing protein n=1 Tax=Cajanus cajan TaxID=3821 RepID=A0A151RG39_CAJCA|nr:hypothetical protein KK1_037116 [Cajanus cajan]